jgi:3',5'-cyclic AMP phosphodiesterase CpdA
MAKENPEIYSEDSQYLENRLAELRTALGSPATKDLDSVIILGLFRWLLAKQEATGQWKDDAGKWTGVQTAVVLKTLARIGYTERSTWYIQGERKLRGGVAKALEFLQARTDIDRIPNENIEDVWDVSQVLLANACYARATEHKNTVDNLCLHWKQAYEDSLVNSPVWSGPAFVAAILDVFIAYDRRTEARTVLDFLLNLGRAGGSCCSGYLRGNEKAEACWHAGLVLRTLSSVQESWLPKSKKVKLLDELSERLLAERDKNPQGDAHPYWGKDKYERDIPMYTARSLEGLSSALPYLSDSVSQIALQAIGQGNLWLSTVAKRHNDLPGIRIGTLKATTAAAEYFSSLSTTVPLVALIDLGQCLEAQNVQVQLGSAMGLRKANTIEVVENGLKIAWLTDLHIGAVDERKQRVFAWPKRQRWFRSAFAKEKNFWTECFAENNLDRILERIVELGCNHVLISGDISNLALPEQYTIAREKFIAHQVAVGQGKDKLSEDYWTIIPGNHDVESSSKDRKYSRFLEHFGEIFNGGRNFAFPFQKTVRSPGDSQLEISIICLDSCPTTPVERIGTNARGEISEDQMESFRKMLEQNAAKGTFTVVVLHHAPIVMPYLKPKLLEFFMALDPSNASDVITLCCTHGVKAVLHGHFHTHSSWLAPVGLPNTMKGYMPIIGAPCGTLQSPGESVVFLELREVKLIGEEGHSLALSLFKHCRSGNTWKEESVGMIIG